MNELMNFANTLKSLIRQRGITTATLANGIGCSSKTISDWLSGGRSPRDLDTVKRCAAYFDVSLHFLLFGEEDPKTGLVNLLDKTEIHSGLYEITVRRVKEKK